jgi:hypothetical protein
MLVTHYGRRTSKRQQNAVEVLGYDRQRREAYVISWSANGRYQPTQRFLDAGEIADVLDAFRQQHPILTAIRALFLSFPRNAARDELRDLERSLGGMVFRHG